MLETFSPGAKSRMYKYSEHFNFSQEHWLTLPEDIPRVNVLLNKPFACAFAHAADLSSTFPLSTVIAI
jgi:hypothetical protein